MNDQRAGATAAETIANLARIIAPDAIGHTYCPSEVRVRAEKQAPLPAASVALSMGASAEDTAFFLERTQREQSQKGEKGDRAAPPPSTDVEAYDIVAPIGRGGMGEVWRAVQRALGREIALKQLSIDDPSAEEYFLSEARVTARLSHANIVPVHTLGRSDAGRPMLAMKLIKGRSWLDVLREERPELDVTAHLRVFLSVCNAVAFAHAEGFLHRDLKPENVMVGEFGQVFVVDWGLAVGLDPAVCRESGILYVRDVRSPAGTPAYMAPELALGDGAAQGPPTDVYCLGAILHEIVTGRPPHAADKITDALKRAVESSTPVYSAAVPRELAEICQRAMAKDPADRYPDVASLRAAVEAFLAHDAARAISAKGTRALRALREQIEQHASVAAPNRAESERAIHRTYTQARFAFELSLESWPEDEDAKRGIEATTRVMLEHALAVEDLGLASRLAAEIDDAELTERLNALRETIAARDRELSALRENAALLDDRRVARPLGAVFIVAGLAGGLAAIPTRMFLDRGAAAGTMPITALWSVLTLATGAYAYFVLRGATKSLISPRVGWTWAGVGVCCMGAGAVSVSQGGVPFENAAYTTMMISIGFVAQALQTRLWLLFPAITTFLGALAMGVFPRLNVEIFGAIWLVSLTGVGIVLRRQGATAADSQSIVMGTAAPMGDERASSAERARP